MAQKRSEDTSTTLIETTPEAAPTAPPWLAEALAVLRALRVSGMLSALPDRLRVERGRAGIYVAADFLLVLLTFAVSDAPHLKAFFQQLPPVALALGALWDRAALPSRSALSRFLDAVQPHHVTRFAACGSASSPTTRAAHRHAVAQTISARAATTEDRGARTSPAPARRSNRHTPRSGWAAGARRATAIPSLNSPTPARRSCGT